MSGILQDNYWFSNESTFEIGNSLRFRGAQYLQLSALPNDTDRALYVQSVWIKRGEISSSGAQTISSKTYSSTSSDVSLLSTDVLRGRSTSGSVSTTMVFRDPCAWYHLVWKTNSTTANNQGVLWVNGVQIATNITWPSLGGTDVFNIGRRATDNDNFFTGYMAQYQCVNGNDSVALDQTSFGEYNAEGVWVPKNYAGAYGPMGFYLDFSDSADIGADRSGNGNDFTATGFELADTTSVNYDLFTDSPTTNSALWNPLDGSTRTNFFDANVIAQRTSSDTYGQSVPSIQYMDGKVSYSEHYFGSIGADFGALPSNFLGVGNYIYGVNSNNQNGFDAGLITYIEDGGIYVDSVLASTGIALTTNCIVGVKVDRSVTPNTVQFYKDGVASGSAASLVTGDILYGFAYTRSVINPVNNGNVYWNGGGQPWQHAPSGITKANAVTVKNLLAATIQDPSDHFDVITDTGANILTAAQAKFSNGLWWIKDRVNVDENQLVDSLRGGALMVASSAAASESSYVTPTGNSVAWCWKAGASASNNLGSISSTTAANSTAGFSIVTWTGNGSGSAETIGHGLSTAPEVVFLKSRSDGIDGWYVYHSGLIDASYALFLNLLLGPVQNNGYWNSTPPSSSVFTVGSATSLNRNNDNYVAYCWAPVAGYSSFGSYEGNGITDGPFVYTGFKPEMVMVKSTQNANRNWYVIDDQRSPYNPVENDLYWNRLEPENSGSVSSTPDTDFLSNGFKLRTTDNAYNLSGTTYIYMAFAKNPFGGSNVAPATAR